MDEFMEKMKEDSEEYMKSSVQRRKAVEYITENVKMIEEKEEDKEE
jgi:hypothetical protein